MRYLRSLLVELHKNQQKKNLILVAQNQIGKSENQA